MYLIIFIRNIPHEFCHAFSFYWEWVGKGTVQSTRSLMFIWHFYMNWCVFFFLFIWMMIMMKWTNTKIENIKRDMSLIKSVEVLLGRIKKCEKSIRYEFNVLFLLTVLKDQKPSNCRPLKKFYRKLRWWRSKTLRKRKFSVLRYGHEPP